MLKYKYTIESWRPEADNVKASLEKAEDLAEGSCNMCSDVMEEWGIDEIEDSLKTFTLKDEDVEQVRASSEAEITNWSLLDAEAMKFLVVSLAKLIARVEEQVWLTKKGIKGIVSLMVKGCLRAQSVEAPEESELAELSDKWTTGRNHQAKDPGLYKMNNRQPKHWKRFILLKLYIYI